MPTPADSPPTAPVPTPADSADRLSVLGEQLAILRTRVEALERVLTHRRQDADPPADSSADRMPTAADTPPTGADTPRGTHDPATAFARIHALRAQGLSLAQIADHLNAEGLPTRRGQPWRKGMVGWFLHKYGQ
jgi:hypothetical protein